MYRHMVSRKPMKTEIYLFNFLYEYAIILFMVFITWEKVIIMRKAGGVTVNNKTLQKRELDYFFVEESYGGNQDRFPDPRRRDCGGGAIAAWESSVFFARRAGMDKLYPYRKDEITWEEYHEFSYLMKHYLCPGPDGIDTLEMFMNGFEEYLEDVHEQRVKMNPFHGNHTYEEARKALCRQIDNDCPIPYLLLKHQNSKGYLEDYIWHWFIVAGYEEKEDDLMVKAVSYGEYKWFPLKELWDTGYDRKGGMILFHIEQ